VPLSWNLRTLTSWNPLGHSRPVTGLLHLHMFRAHRAHHQERKTVSIQPLVAVDGRVMCRSEVKHIVLIIRRETVSIQPLVAVTLCRWSWRVQVGSELPTCTWHGHRQLPEVVLTQFFSPDDEHDVLETCREIKIKIKINTQKIIVRHVGRLPRSWTVCIFTRTDFFRVSISTGGSVLMTFTTASS